MGESTATITLIMKARNMASAELGKTQSAMSRLKGAAGGLGLGMLGVAGAVGLATGALLKGISGAIDEEKSIARLTAALDANVPAWGGNLSAITALISERERLAFSDDDLRDSLGTLVAATHDVTKAQDLQATAMDLARFRGIGLTDAAEALVKVEGGQYRLLKSLGIVLKDNATQEEALAAVQAVAFGQAETYANTTAGKLETAQIRINDAFENFGGLVLPVVADAIADLTVELGRFGDQARQTSWEISTYGFFGGGFPRNVHELTREIHGAAGATEVYGTKAADAARANDALSGSFKSAAKTGAGWWSDYLSGTLNPDLRETIDLINLAIKRIGQLPHRTTGPGSHGIGHIPGTASGGWVGLNGPEIRSLGEEGPEYVIPNHALRGGGGSPGYVAVGVSKRDIARMVDEELYFRLQRKPT